MKKTKKTYTDDYFFFEESRGPKVAYYMFVSRRRLGWTLSEAIKPEKRIVKERQKAIMDRCVNKIQKGINKAKNKDKYMRGREYKGLMERFLKYKGLGTN